MYKNTISIFIILLISAYGCTTDQNGKFTSLFNGKDLTTGKLTSAFQSLRYLN